MTPEDEAAAGQIDAGALERICALGWPGLHEQWYGDWLLRAGHGFTGRANSVLVLGEPAGDFERDGDFEKAMDVAGRWYGEHELPLRFQVPHGEVSETVASVDRRLQAGGWRRTEDVAVLVADLGNLATALSERARPSPDVRIELAGRPGADWLSLYHYRGKPLPRHAIDVISAGPAPFFVTVLLHGRPAAVVRGVCTQGWLGVTALTVPEALRRRGLATTALLATVEHGRAQGARSAYLQVARDNGTALSLYTGLGFWEHHGYHYRDRPLAGDTVER